MSNAETLFARMRSVADHPRAQLDRYLAQGHKAVLCAPVYTPAEIVHAMGMVPMGAWGADQVTREAKTYCPAFICSILQTLLDLGMSGAFSGASAILIPNLCDSLKPFGQNWKCGVKDIPYIPVNYPQQRNLSYAKDYTLAGYRRLISELEAITGLRFQEDALVESIRLYNARSKAMRRFSELAAEKAISPSQRSAVFKSAYFLLCEEHLAMLTELNREMEALPAVSGRIRAVTTGILADSPNLLAILDKQGYHIVGDDIAAESRQYRTDAPEDGVPLEALAIKFNRMGSCSVLYDAHKTRAQLVAELAAQRQADLVLMLQTKFCDPEEFDFVPLRKTVEQAGIPILQIEVDRQMQHYEQLSTLLQAFAETI